MSVLLLVFLPVGMLVAVARHLLAAILELRPRETGQSRCDPWPHRRWQKLATHLLRRERRDAAAGVDAVRDDDIAAILIMCCWRIAVWS